MKKNCFIISNPKPHYVHKKFADSVCEYSLNCLLYKQPRYKFLFLTIKSFILNFKLIKKMDSFLLIGGVGLFISFLIKIFFPQKKIILLHADPFFYDLKYSNKFKKFFFKILLLSITGVISNSKLNLFYSKNYFSKVDFVYPFLKKELFKINPIISNLKNKVDILYIGRDSPEKNIQFIINFANKNNYNLHLIGDINKNKYTYNIKNTYFYSKLNFSEIYNLHKKIKFNFGFLLSNYDSFGITPLEYSLMGIIPLLSKKCGSNEILNDNRLIISKNFNAIENKINYFKSLNEQELIEFINILNNRIKQLDLNELNSTKKFKKIYNNFI